MNITRMREQLTCLSLWAMILTLAACRGELPLLPSEEEQVTVPQEDEEGSVRGFFLLNEGNMGNNKCTLDYFDYASGRYHRNIYAERNPGVVKELGDVGNDIGIYGEKLYAVINCSHMVEVMDVHTAQHLGSIDITNCRYISFYGGKAYVSSYAGPVQVDPEARPGKVVEIDTLTLQPTREVTVGYQPEEMVITNDRLYVANSGGYRFPNYDRTISIVDLKSFTVVDVIDVAINLHRMELDKYGRIYVSSRGDYDGTGSDVFVIDVSTHQVVGNLGIAASEMCLCGDSLYVTSSEWNYDTNSNKVSYALYDIGKQQLVTDSFITDGTESQIALPYGVGVNPDNGDIFVIDAGDYITPGYLYCYSRSGVLKWKVRTGDVPAHFAFTRKPFY